MTNPEKKRKSSRSSSVTNNNNQSTTINFQRTTKNTDTAGNRSQKTNTEKDKSLEWFKRYHTPYKDLPKKIQAKRIEENYDAPSISYNEYKKMQEENSSGKNRKALEHYGKVEDKYYVDLRNIKNQSLKVIDINKDPRGMRFIPSYDADQILDEWNSDVTKVKEISKDELQVIVNSVSRDVRRELMDRNGKYNELLSLFSGREIDVSIPVCTYENLMERYNNEIQRDEDENFKIKMGTYKKRIDGLKNWTKKVGEKALEDFTEEEVDEILSNYTWYELHMKNAKENELQRFGIEIEYGANGLNIPYKPTAIRDNYNGDEKEANEQAEEFKRFARKRGHKGFMKSEKWGVELHLDAGGGTQTTGNVSKTADSVIEVVFNPPLNDAFEVEERLR